MMSQEEETLTENSSRLSMPLPPVLRPKTEEEVLLALMLRNHPHLTREETQTMASLFVIGS
jgi:hypothetical protein